MNLHAVRRASTYLMDRPNVLVCVGSGLSAESGIPTFRGSGGMFNDSRIATYTDIETLKKDPQGMLSWYQERRVQLQQVRPNAGHFALARLAATGNYTIATQNVDNLMEVACQTENVHPDIHHVHGLLSDVKCTGCQTVISDLNIDLSTLPSCESCGGQLRPGVILFGEELPHDAMEASTLAAQQADICMVIGTSGLVYPAASLPEIARNHGAKIIEINLELTALSDLCDVIVRGNASMILPVLERVVTDAL